MPLLKWLDRLDKDLFAFVQHNSGHGILDSIMLLLRNPYTWVPLYAFILFYAYRKRKNRVWPFIVLSLVTFAITDTLCAQLLKPLFGRLRPCYEPELASLLRGLVDCGGRYSMPSNHAANHFGLATFWYFSVRRMSGKKWSWLWIWAAAICYAQVYVGKHYPFDTFVGAILGFITGFGMFRLFSYWEKKSLYLYHPTTTRGGQAS